MAKKVSRKKTSKTSSSKSKKTATKVSRTSSKKTSRSKSTKTAARKSTARKPVKKASASKTKKKVAKRSSQVKKSALEAFSGSFYWKFPREDFQLLRVEIAVLIILSALVFLYIYLQPELNLFISIVSVLLFLAIYFVVSAILRKLRRVEELYELSKTHLDIQRYVNGRKTAHHKVSLKDVKMHKFDHVFHGAYVVLHDGTRHPLYFSSGAESRHVERKLKGHLRR